MSNNATHRSTGHLILNLFTEVANLFQSEVRLVRTEFAERVSNAVTALTTLSVAAIILMAALAILLQAAVAALMTFGIPAQWAGLIVAVVAGVVGLILMTKTLCELKSSDLAPRHTMDQLHKDFRLAKEQLK